MYTEGGRYSEDVLGKMGCFGNGGPGWTNLEPTQGLIDLVHSSLFKNEVLALFTILHFKQLLNTSTFWSSKKKPADFHKKFCRQYIGIRTVEFDHHHLLRYQILTEI